MNKNFINLLSDSLDINTIRYPIDVHIYELLNINKLTGNVLYPFLIMPDVTDSDNIGARSQEEFCTIRKYILSDYKFLSVTHIDIFKQYLNINCISLRHEYHANNITYSKLSDKCGDLIKPLLVYSDEQSFNINFLCDLIDVNNIKFVFIVPSYNNKNNYIKNLESIYNQSYPKYLYRVIYIDDCSDDNTFEYVESWMIKNNIHNMQLIKTHQHSGQGYARYVAVQQTSDNEVLVMLDGDDWLYGTDVMKILNDNYIKYNLLASYGSYYVHDGNPDNMKLLQATRQFPAHVIENKTYRSYDWISGHLRTCYSKLFKNIDIKHLQYDGKFLRMSSDRAEMIPILEQAGNRHRNIKLPLCVYNKFNSLLYDTSYYRIDEITNKKNKILRENIGIMINNRPVYETI